MSAQHVTKKCKGCGRSFKGHPNKKFHSKKCKDTYWNWKNPRGKFARLSDPAYVRQMEIDELERIGTEAMEEGWDGHKAWTQ